MSYDLVKDYDILRYNDRLRVFENISEQDAEYVRKNGYIVPMNSGYYQAKNVLIGVIINNTIVYYKAQRK